MKIANYEKMQPGDLVQVPRTQFAPMRRGWNGWLFSEAVVLRKTRGKKSNRPRQRGCTTGKQIIRKECRIKKRIKACSLQKKWGAAQKDADGSCLGFSNENDDEPIDKCKNCIACSAFDWEEERRRLSI